jgi:hypothetical protein
MAGDIEWLRNFLLMEPAPGAECPGMRPEPIRKLVNCRSHRGAILFCLIILLTGAASGCGREQPHSSGLVSGIQAAAGEAEIRQPAYATFAEWKAACDRLPSNRSLRFAPPPRDLLPIQDFQLFSEALESFFEFVKKSSLSDPGAWLGQGPSAAFFETDLSYFTSPAIPFEPFVQRLLVPAGSQLLIRGDMHGDIQSLVAWLEWLNQQGYLDGFRIVRPNAYIILLGDYTDRGMCGVEVLYTLLRLKMENPGRVVLVRGNHEDADLAVRYGLVAEGRAKYGSAFDARRVLRLYDFLPVAVYAGCGPDVLQCNHGGLEPGFSAGQLLDAPETTRFQMLGTLEQKSFLRANPSWTSNFPAAGKRLAADTYADFKPQSPTVPSLIGFMWNDFTVVAGEPEFQHDPGRAFVYGQRAARHLMQYSSGRTRRIQAVFRAHQHSSVLTPMMQRLKASGGIHRHWQETDSLELLNSDSAILKVKLEQGEIRRIPANSVWTLNVSPDTIYGEGCKFTFDSFGLIWTAEKFEDWRLHVITLDQQR